MIGDLIPALLAATVVAFVPGYFWAKCLCATRDFYSHIAYSAGLSLILSPALALIPARFLGMGVTLPVAVGSLLAVFLSGLGAWLVFGTAKSVEEPAAAPSAPLGTLTLLLLIPVLGLTLAVVLKIVDGEKVLPAILALTLFAGAVHLVESWRTGTEETASASSNSRWSVARHLLLPLVLAAVLFRGYSGVVLHDWPYLRGGDQFNHGVMANEMLSSGSYDEYLVYPPGFHTAIAEVSRLSGLRPLEIFPVLAPAFMVLPTLAIYALATRLWGWGYGVAAAAFYGLLLAGSYENFALARYPNFISVHFLMVLAVAALVGLYAAPSIRTGAAFAVLGSSVVLYHPVASLYMALLLALVGVTLLPYLLLRRRREGLMLLSSMLALGFISVLYAWDTYNLPGLISGLFDGANTGAGGAAVSQAVGTQFPAPLSHLPASVSQPVLWLGLFGVFMLVSGYGARGLPSFLSRATLLLWTLLLFAGSRTALSGFPERFERDLGVPLALFAALAGVSILRSVRVPGWSVTRSFVALGAVVVGIALVGAQAAENLRAAVKPTSQALMTPQLEAAGDWLRAHNDGGNIVAPPYIDGVTVRAVLAMGGYTEIQTYRTERIDLARSLPPAGAKPLRDGAWLLHHPAGERTRNIIEEHDIRYIVLHKPDTTIPWRGFVERDALYSVIYENEKEVIVAPRDSS